MTKSAIEREQCKARFIIAKREQTRDKVSRYGRKVCRPVRAYGGCGLLIRGSVLCTPPLPVICQPSGLITETPRAYRRNPLGLQPEPLGIIRKGKGLRRETYHSHRPTLYLPKGREWIVLVASL